MSSKSVPGAPGFTPVSVRHRADGWTPDRQTAFIGALAETGSVSAAAKAVGMSATSAYELRARRDAAEFRAAWQGALDHAIQNLADAALDRAINGVATPIFFQGEQIGERRVYNERLTMFLLRLRDPARFGVWRDRRVPFDAADGVAARFHAALQRVRAAAMGLAGLLGPAPDQPLLMTPRDGDAHAEAEVDAVAERVEGVRRAEAARAAEVEVDEEGGT